MLEDQKFFDFSDYTNTYFLHSNENKKVLEKMNDECHGHITMECVGLKPKMYVYLYIRKKVIEEDKAIYYQEEKKRAKGVSKTVVQSNIQHEN